MFGNSAAFPRSESSNQVSLKPGTAPGYAGEAPVIFHPEVMDNNKYYNVQKKKY